MRCIRTGLIIMFTRIRLMSGRDLTIICALVTDEMTYDGKLHAVHIEIGI